MNDPQRQALASIAADTTEGVPNGLAGAAILAAGAGCAFVGIIGFLADAFKPIARVLTFYQPTGSLSGVSSVAILLWLATWFILGKLWRTRTIAIARVNATAFALLSLGILLTFPPIVDFLQGK